MYGTRAHVPDYMIQGGVRYKFVHDHLGSVRMVLNTANGQVVSRMDYDEFGILQSGSLAPDFAPFGFAGGLRDAATGLVRFGARDYDPETGRWIARDPSLFSGPDDMNSLSLFGLGIETNLYGYSFGDPVNFIDPNGKWAISLIIYIPTLAAGLGYIDYQFFGGLAYDRRIEFEK